MNDRDAAINKIRRLMIRHGITIGELKTHKATANVCERQADLFAKPAELPFIENVSDKTTATL